MKSSKEVTVYSTPTCPHCTSVKQFLKSNGVSFKEVDLTRSFSDQRKVVKATGQLIVPQVEIDGNWVVGFDPGRITQLLNS